MVCMCMKRGAAGAGFSFVGGLGARRPLQCLFIMDVMEGAKADFYQGKKRKKRTPPY